MITAFTCDLCSINTKKVLLCLEKGKQSLWLRFVIIQAFITCSRKGDWKMSHKADSNGLVQGHAYTITGLYRVHAQDLGRICLLRIRNPWGDKNEWKGEQNFSWKEQLKFSPIFLFSLVFKHFCSNFWLASFRSVYEYTQNDIFHLTPMNTKFCGFFCLIFFK